MRKKVGIVNYGMGNLQSVKNVLDHLSVESFLVENDFVLK